MIILIAVLAAIFTMSLFLPGILMILAGLAGLQSDKPMQAMGIAIAGLGLVLMSL